jgi:hypothetical protein
VTDSRRRQARFRISASKGLGCLVGLAMCACSSSGTPLGTGTSATAGGLNGSTGATTSGGSASSTAGSASSSGTTGGASTTGGSTSGPGTTSGTTTGGCGSGMNAVDGGCCWNFGGAGPCGDPHLLGNLDCCTGLSCVTGNVCSATTSGGATTGGGTTTGTTTGGTTTGGATCTPACPAAQNCCNGSCSDPQSDTANCGGCGMPCALGQYCNNALCAAACSASTCGAGTGCCGSDSTCCAAGDVCCLEQGHLVAYKCETGSCPLPPPCAPMCVSRRDSKRDIQYLSDDELAVAESAVRKIPLARFNYKWDAPNERRRLGFIIEDVAPSPGVDEAQGVVDLYGYTSLAVAALQEQAREIEQLRQEVDELQRRLDGPKKQRAQAPAH